jgi:hypothetical protein
MTGQACVEGGPRMVDGLFERCQVLIVRELMVHNGCDTQLRERTQDVFGG